MSAKYSDFIAQPRTAAQRYAVAQRTWFVVADNRLAKIFVQHESSFELIQLIKQPDLDIDGLDNKGRGRGRVSAGTGQHAYEPTMQESRQVEMTLARQVAIWLENEFEFGQFKHLVLVAAPQMLGEIRKNLCHELSAAVIVECNKELANHPEEKLSRELLSIMAKEDRE